jgi:hypothetical protein
MSGVGDAKDRPGGKDRQRDARRVRAQGPSHPPNRLGDDGDGDDLEAVQQAAGNGVVERHHPVAEDHESDSRRHGKGEPCRQSALQPRLGEADSDPDLT